MEIDLLGKLYEIGNVEDQLGIFIGSMLGICIILFGTLTIFQIWSMITNITTCKSHIKKGNTWGGIKLHIYPHWRNQNHLLTKESSKTLYCIGVSHENVLSTGNNTTNKKLDDIKMMKSIYLIYFIIFNIIIFLPT